MLLMEQEREAGCREPKIWHRVVYEKTDGTLVDLGIALERRDQQGFDLYLHTLPMCGSMTVRLAAQAQRETVPTG